MELARKQCGEEENIRMGFPALLYVECKFKFGVCAHVLEGKIYQGAWGYSCTKFGMEGIRIKVDRDFSEGGDRFA